jgi:hypothetical protein
MVVDLLSCRFNIVMTEDNQNMKGGGVPLQPDEVKGTGSHW